MSRISDLAGFSTSLSSTQDLSVGVITATSFSGDGSGLTGVASTDNIQTATDAKFLANVNITGVATANSFVGDGSALTGIDATSIKDSGGNVKAQANPAGVVVTGVITATTGSFDGNVSVGGTLTYQDVTNVDSVGMVTARKGLQVLADGANITGIVTATSFEGDGSALTGVGVGTEDNINTSGIITATRFVGSGTSLRFAPKVIAFNPLALQENVSIASSIHITFDQNIHFVGSGDVVIREGSSNGTGIQTFSISSGAGPSGLSIVDTQLIIEPTSNFNLGTSIYVTLPSSGIANTEGDFFAGSSNYNFKTVSSTFSASGGDYEFSSPAPTSPTGYYRYHVFSGSGILTTTSSTSSATDFQLLMMAGGGGGGVGGGPPGYRIGGGGGAGGRISRTGPEANFPAGTYTVTVGHAGYGGRNLTGIGTQNPNYGPGQVPVSPEPGYLPQFYAMPGGDSTISGPGISTLRAIGGGAGGMSPTPTSVLPAPAARYGAPGGSGGGTSNNASTPGTGTAYPHNQPYPQASPTFTYTNSGTGTPGQGHPGGGYILSPSFSNLPQPYYHGPGGASQSCAACGGGGGAGGAGGNADIQPHYFSPNPTPINNNETRAAYIFAGPGGDGATNPAFPSTQLSGGLPGDFTELFSTMGPTGLLGGGGGGARHPALPPGSNPTASPTQGPGQFRGLGGPGGGGDGGGDGPSPQGGPQRGGVDGQQFTGSGGGGGMGNPNDEMAGHGGSGIIMIRYATPS